MEIGFIGLGIMGKPMAANLLKAGYRVRVKDINRKAERELAEKGAMPCVSMEELAQSCDTIILMLPDSPQVEQVMLGEEGLLRSIRPHTMVIDMSSINPDVSRRLEHLLSEKDCEMLDAPVSGGEPKAVDGTLSVMCGGKQEAFDRALPVLQAMAGSVTRVGDIGSGNMCKLANQIIVAGNIAALAEAIAFVKKAGGDPQKVFEAVRRGLAGSQVMEDKAPMMLSGNDAPGFRMKLHVKDLSNAVRAAETAKIRLPLTDMVLEMMKKLCAQGKENADHSALAQYYEEYSRGE